MRNMHEFGAALSQVTAEATRATITSAQARVVVDAAASGGAEAVARAVQGLSTAELQELKRQLEG
jgi:hypothetical protein